MNNQKSILTLVTDYDHRFKLSDMNKTEKVDWLKKLKI